jgi:outer membrane protein OmpA-like peptidoglycan-associated protein
MSDGNKEEDISMRHYGRALPAVLALTLVAGALAPVSAQGIGGRIRQRAQQKVEDRAVQRAGEGVDKALDKAEGAIACAVTDSKCIQNAEKSGKQVMLTDENGNVVGHSAAEAAAPGSKAWANYDFVPGERVLFAEDFSADRVGNFPRRLEFIGGNMEIVEANGMRYLRASSASRLAVKLPETLPERFTVEFDITVPANWESLLFFSGEGVRNLNAAPTGACCYVPAAAIFISPADVGLRRDEGSKVAYREIGDLLGSGAREGKLMRIRMHVDGKYAKLYLNETRVANVPNLEIPRTDKLYFDLNAQDDVPMLLGNLSINAGGLEIYEALAAEGRVVTRGILFDTGSDRLRPESTPTLKEIGEMLKAYPDLRLLIEGHTDSVGNAASNQTLSEKRAAAVKAFLEKEYKIKGDRLESKGFGDTTPNASNDTPEGRQSNRRVELVKL